MVLKLCDELDKAKELNDYFKQTLEKHIAKEILPHLQKLKQETLIKEFVKQWKDFTILVHYLRKMFSYLVTFSLYLLGPILPQKLQHEVSSHECVGILQGTLFPQD